MAETTQIVIPLYPGVTHLDFTGPHQVLCRLPGAKVVVASMGGQDIEADGLTFGGLADLAAVERADVLCVPGGLGTTEAMLDQAYMAQVNRLAAGAKYLTSVCTGSLILAATGRLRGRRAACHWAWRDLLEPFGAIVDESRVARDGNIITGGGVTAGIDFALVLAAELAGEETARAIQLTLEYAPAPPYDSGRPESATPETRERIARVFEGLMPNRRAAALEAARRLEAV
ncbi:DJ-1/PfpI family protein [Phenylobacterium terrae]|uniref:DJ-1/PfpI family protein n=1 Tax=Phenylobacterium terrae TaxID=2665495 RepID=A0ABW4N311_9CAUL